MILEIQLKMLVPSLSEVSGVGNWNEFITNVLEEVRKFCIYEIRFSEN